MYYRIAIQTQSSPIWRWVSTPLGSMNRVTQWLLFYQAVPRDRLRVFEAPSREALSEQLLSENGAVSSRATPAAKFVSADSDGPLAARSETAIWFQDAGSHQVRVLEKSSTSPLDRRRDELERGAGSDHDLPYCFSIPASMPQLLAWAKLLARVECGDLHAERMPVGAGTGSRAECADEVSCCMHSNTAA